MATAALTARSPLECRGGLAAEVRGALGSRLWRGGTTAETAGSAGPTAGLEPGKASFLEVEVEVELGPGEPSLGVEGRLTSGPFPPPSSVAGLRLGEPSLGSEADLGPDESNWGTEAEPELGISESILRVRAELRPDEPSTGVEPELKPGEPSAGVGPELKPGEPSTRTDGVGPGWKTLGSAPGER